MDRALGINGAPAKDGREGACWGEKVRTAAIAIAAAQSGTRRDSRPCLARRGFTLFEMVIVLAIMAILASASVPAFFSAVNEHRVREDGHMLAMMVREAMIQSGEQHRPFVIDLTKSSLSLHPEGELAKTDDDSDASMFKDSGSNATNADQSLADTVTENVDTEKDLESGNKVQEPDPSKKNGWMDVPDDGTSWVFQPGELCPATTVRIARGDAYLEMSFEALTGAVKDEKYYFP